MDQSTQDTSDMETSSSEEVKAWQDVDFSEGIDCGDVQNACEEWCKEVIDQWLTKHGESLFKLQSSKAIAKLGTGDACQVRRTCSLKTPYKPPRNQSGTKRRTNQDCTFEEATGQTLKSKLSPFVPQEYTAAEYKKVLDFNK